MNKRIKLFSGGAFLIETTNETYSNANFVAITGFTVCSIQLLLPARPYFNLSILSPVSAVAYNEVVSKTVSEMFFGTVIPVEHTGVPFISFAVMDNDTLPAVGLPTAQNKSYL